MLKKSIIKDYFNVPQLENHGPHHVDDNPRKLNQTIIGTHFLFGEVSTRILQEVHSLSEHNVVCFQ